MARTVSKRVEKARAFRQRVIESPEFQKWWQHRRTMQPTPSDPFRAYMIDRGLRAAPYDEVSWQDYVNRSDLAPVDNPQQGFIPDDHPIHRRKTKKRHINRPDYVDRRPQITRIHRTPTYVPPSKRRVSHEKQKLYQSLVDFSGKFNSFYNLPDLDVIVEEREGAAYSRPFMPGERAKILIPVNYYNAVRKSKQKRFHRQLFASFGHEEGHHLQYAYGGGDDVVPRGDSDVVNMFKGSEWTGAREDSVSKSRATAENFAWNALQRFVELKTPRQLPKMKGAAKLRRNWAFGTYTKHTPSIMSGADKKITYDWRTNLLVRPHEAGSDFFSSPKVRITGISSEARLRKKRKSR